jgi:hypothetical protein
MAHLLAQAEQGDASVLPALRTYLDQTPELWQTVGDLGYQAQAALIERASGANLLLQESLGRQLEAMRHELSGPVPMPLERLLVDRIVLCWLRVSIAEVRVNLDLTDHQEIRDDGILYSYHRSGPSLRPRLLPCTGRLSV